MPLTGLSALDLTPEERAFLEQHAVIRTQCSHGSPAFEQVRDGEPTGYIIEYLRLLAKTAGFSIDFGEGMHAWEETEQKFRDRAIDFLTGTVDVEQYAAYALLSDPYLYFQRVYVVRKEASDVRSPTDLIGQTVSAMPELSFVDVWKTSYPGIRFLMVDSDEEALRAVADGSADATFTLKSTFDYVAARHGFSNLRIGGMENKAEGLENCFRMAIRSDWPELLSIVNKAMGAIPQRDRQRLWQAWFAEDMPQPPLHFSPEELTYIQEHPVLRYSTLSDAPPLEYKTPDGTSVGLTHDYMKRVEEQTGMRLIHVPANTRPEKRDHLLAGRCDLLPTFAPYDLTDDVLLRTPVYMTFPLVIATRIDVPFINTPADCKGRRVGLVTRIGVLQAYRKEFPEVTLVGCASVGDGLRDVSQGKLFGIIGPQPVVAHQIQELYLGNLKIAGTLDETLQLCAVVRTEDRILRDILQKVLLSVSPEEQARMLNRWISIRLERGFDYRLFWRTLGGAGAVLLLLLMRYRMVARYNRRLKALNDKRERALKERDRILSVLSHDLRQPMHGCSQFLALVQQGAVNPATEEGQEIVRQVRHRSEQAIECMENLLSRMGGARKTRRPVTLSPYRLVEDGRELLAASIENKRLALKNRMDPEIRIRADEQELAMVLRNLLNNAIKFSHRGQSIEAEAEGVDGGLRLSVCDHGVGMDAETVRGIKHGERATGERGTEGERGSGLGLSLCRSVLRELGSELEIASAPGQGTRVSFVLRDQMPRTSC